MGVDDSNHPDIDMSQIVFFDSESDFSSPGQENDHDMESRQDIGSFKIKQEKELIIIDEAPMICNEYQSNNERDVPRISSDLNHVGITELNSPADEEDEPEVEDEKNEMSSSLSSLADHQYSIPQDIVYKDNAPYDEVIRNIIDTSKSEANNNTIELLLNFVDAMQNHSNEFNLEFLDSIKFSLQTRKNKVNTTVMNGDQQVAIIDIKQETGNSSNENRTNLEKSSLIETAQKAGQKYMEKLDNLRARSIGDTSEEKLSFEKDLRSCLNETKKELASLAYEMKQKQILMNKSNEKLSDISASSSSFSCSDSDSSTSRLRRKKLTKVRKNSRSSNSNEKEMKSPSKKVRPSTIIDEDIERLLAFETIETKRKQSKSEKSKQNDEQQQNQNKIKTNKESENNFLLESSSEDDTSEISSNVRFSVY